ncbi:DDE-type integrase/transposase/recombinase, partial [Streptomyces sp. NPDC054833]
MTEIVTSEGKLYLACVIDLFSRRLLGYAMGERHDAELVVASLNMAATIRGGPVAPAKKAAAKRAAPTRKAAKKTMAKASADKAVEPSLGDLLKQILDKHSGQPRTAAEVTSELEREFPERARNTNVVRNTLERLVAKSAVERTKQKSTVLYASHGSAAA